MLEPCAGQKLGLFVSAPEVAIRMLRDQGRPSPFEPNFGRPEPRKIRRLVLTFLSPCTSVP
jgi:hypothetical protein